MKIYFTASARGIKKLKDNYSQIYQTIEKLGHSNLDKLVLNLSNNELYQGSHQDQVQLYKTAMDLIKQSDVVILEVSTHSLSMGFVMQKALELNKPVIALYTKGCSPYFAAGIENDKLQVIEYDSSNLSKALQEAIAYASEKQDTRFNFFVAPKHLAYLDWISKTRRIPRSVFLRRLIEKEINQDKDYLN